MTQTDAEFMKEMDYFDTYGAGCGFETPWSIYDENIQMGDNHPFQTPMTIQNKCDVWGYDASAVCTGKKWGDIWQACDAVIRNSVDSDGNKDHHIFIEDLEAQGNGVWNLVTGS